MRKTLACVFGIALCAPLPAPAQQEPKLINEGPLLYPPIARAARVSGTVKLEFQILPDGSVNAVTTTDGPTMLRGAAESFVKSWKFDPVTLGANADDNYTVTIAFIIQDVEAGLDPRSNSVTVHSDSFRHFEIATAISDIQISNCPTGADEDVPSERHANDYVEIYRSTCYGTCPGYTVRVNADGTIQWEGDAFVDVIGKRTAGISPDESRALLEKFRTAAFWSYCGDYSRSITDNPGTQITVSLGGRTRTISDYADSSPKELRDLLVDVDRASDSHRWRHGDPAHESITRIGSDTWLPKPGVTPLMRAAGRDEVDQLKALIASGADVNATDSSGWTALMYASRVSSDYPVQELLKAGADPNQSSPHGDTPLMVDALSGYWNEDLIKAGAHVNARNKGGQTALMMMATRPEPDEIAAALKDGADPTLKDNHGRTALDYLHLASCGKSPLRDSIREAMEIRYRTCNALDSDDVKKTRALLNSATRAHR
jgi:TonB family protein